MLPRCRASAGPRRLCRNFCFIRPSSVRNAHCATSCRATYRCRMGCKESRQRLSINALLLLCLSVYMSFCSSMFSFLRSFFFLSSRLPQCVLSFFPPICPLFLLALAGNAFEISRKRVKSPWLQPKTCSV